MFPFFLLCLPSKENEMNRPPDINNYDIIIALLYRLQLKKLLSKVSIHVYRYDNHKLGGEGVVKLMPI